MSVLSDLAVGSVATVARVTRLDEVGCRLLEMGLTPGVSLKVIGKAPFGDPIEIEVRHYRLSLRKSEAAVVELDD